MGESRAFQKSLPMSNNWSYSKGEPRKEPLDITAHKTEDESAEKMPMNEVAASYQKGEGVLIPKAFIVIVTGGEREVDYFKRVSAIEKLKVASFVEPNFDKDDEPRIFKFAIDKVEDYKASSSPDNPDSYYLITDVDHFGRHIVAHHKECEDAGIRVIVSNPCFEVWLYYGYHSDKFVDFVKPDELGKLSSALKTYVNTSVEGGLNVRNAIFKISESIENSELNYSCDENQMPELYSTDMFILGKDILPFIEEELKAQEKRIEELAMVYRGKVSL